MWCRTGSVRNVAMRTHHDGPHATRIRRISHVCVGRIFRSTVGQDLPHLLVRIQGLLQAFWEGLSRRRCREIGSRVGALVEHAVDLLCLLVVFGHVVSICVYSLCPIARYKQIRVGGEAREVDGSCLYREETNGSVLEKQRVSFAPETSDDTRGYLAGTSHKRTAAVCVCGVCPFCGWCIHIPYVIRRFSSEKLPRTTATLPPSIEPPSPLRRPNTQTTPPSWLLCTLSQAARSDRTSYVVPATPEAQNFDATSAALAHSSSCSLQAVFAGSAKLKQKALAHGNDLQTRHRLIR